ncbi:MAG: hypothetical protein ACREQZ_05745, partial [Woeseiaceae bacterium]
AEPRADQRLPVERRLADSRAEIESMLIPEPDTFPRSHTMRFLLGRNGKVLAIGAFAGLLAVKPRLAMTLIRLLPLGRAARRIL